MPALHSMGVWLAAWLRQLETEDYTGTVQTSFLYLHGPTYLEEVLVWALWEDPMSWMLGGTPSSWWCGGVVMVGPPNALSPSGHGWCAAATGTLGGMGWQWQSASYGVPNWIAKLPKERYTTCS